MSPQLLALAAFLAAFALAARLEPWFQTWAGNRAGSANVLRVALGDARKLFASQSFTQADVYFHSGYYPSIFDQKLDKPSGMVSAAAGTSGHAGHDDLPEFLGKSRDWIEAFGRSFFPSEHRHLGDGPRNPARDPQHDAHAGESHEGHEDHDAANAAGLEREMLPWLRLSATLDPEQPKTYTIAAFWLRTRLNKSVEAEQFLREGLQHNPGNHEILFELGRIYFADRKDLGRARNVWELALKNWRSSEASKSEPDLFSCGQILGHLATLEDQEGRHARALEHLHELLRISPYKDAIRKWIGDVEAKLKVAH